MDKELVSYLESAWNSEGGFFYQLRHGNIKLESAHELVKQLNSYNAKNNGILPKKVVSKIWYIPIFMEWQTERVVQNSGLQKSEYENIKSTIQSAVESILGVP